MPSFFYCLVLLIEIFFNWRGSVTMYKTLGDQEAREIIRKLPPRREGVRKNGGVHFYDEVRGATFLYPKHNCFESVSCKYIPFIYSPLLFL